MAQVTLAPALARWLPSRRGPLDVAGRSVAEVLERLFALHPTLRGYVVDERGALRHHVAVFVDGEALKDKRDLSQALEEGAQVHVMQALSGG